jgi:hypothetical protein
MSWITALYDFHHVRISAHHHPAWVHEVVRM